MGNARRARTGHEVEAKRSAEEIEQDRKAAERAIELKQQRLQAEKAAADLQAQREAEQERVRAAEQPPLRRNPRTTHALRNARVHAEIWSLFPAPCQATPMTRNRAWRRRSGRWIWTAWAHRVTPSWSAPVPRSRASSWPATAAGVIALFRKSRTSRTAATFTAWTTPAPATHGAGPGRFPGNDGVCRSKGGQAPC